MTETQRILRELWQLRFRLTSREDIGQLAVLLDELEREIGQAEFEIARLRNELEAARQGALVQPQP